MTAEQTVTNGGKALAGPGVLKLADGGLAASADTASPPPLASFDGAGQPTTVSYQLPEPNRIVGTHYLILSDYDESDFQPVVGDHSTKPAVASAVGRPAVAAVPRVAAAAAVPNVAAAAAVDLVDAVVCPDSVVLSDPANEKGHVVLVHPYPLSDDLAKLTWGMVGAIAGAGKQVEIYRSASGQWHYRVGTTPAGPDTFIDGAAARSLAMRPANTKVGTPPDPPTPPLPLPSWFTLAVTSPDPNVDVHGPSDGYTLTVSGTWTGARVSGVRITVSITGGPTVPATLTAAKGWSASFVLTASAQYDITVTGTANGNDGSTPQPTKSLTVNVILDQPPTQAHPEPAPTVAIEPPGQWIQPSGDCIGTLTGTFDTNGGSALGKVLIDVPDAGITGLEPTYTSRADGQVTDWTATVTVSAGSHAVTVSGLNAHGLQAPSVTASVVVVPTAPFRRLQRTLVLAETLVLTSYATGIAAGDVVKVFSLLPGEEATFTCSTYTKDSTTAKSAASVLDSNSTEASADFEDTLSDERASKNDTQKTTQIGLDVSVGAKFGVGEASVKGSYSDKANSSREDTTKSVSSALSKHASKASSNRSVTINTENTTTTESGNTEDSTRTVRNINVGRVLNFVFRRLLQEHLVTLALTDAVLLDCTVDLMLNADGTPMTSNGSVVIRKNTRQYSLAEIDDFATANLTDTAGSLKNDITRILSNVADANGALQALVEDFVPTIDGVAHPEEKYLRVRPGLTQPVTTTTGAVIDVDGIVLRTDITSMPSDTLIVDSLLGGGLALDVYSQGLQAVTVDERRAAVAREALAQQIVAQHDDTAAGIWQKVFAPPEPPFVAIPTTGGSNG